MKFGNRLKMSRLEKGLTQEQVANHFYVTRQTISGWENEVSYPDITNLINISDYYQISLDTLLKEDSGMKDYLKKQEVARSIKPITFLLLVIDLLSAGILILSIMNVISLSGFSTYTLEIIAVLNAIALIQIALFQSKLDEKSKFNFSQLRVMLMGISLTIIGLLLLFLGKFSLISGVVTGVGVATIFINIFYKYLNRSYSN